MVGGPGTQRVHGVDLPDPLGPMMATKSPRNVQIHPLSAGKPAPLRHTPWSRRAAGSWHAASATWRRAPWFRDGCAHGCAPPMRWSVMTAMRRLQSCSLLTLGHARPSLMPTCTAMAWGLPSCSTHICAPCPAAGRCSPRRTAERPGGAGINCETMPPRPGRWQACPRRRPDRRETQAPCWAPAARRCARWR